MFSTSVYVEGLAVIGALAVVTWLLSVYIRNVSIVDSLWSIMFLVLAAVYLAGAAVPTPRGVLMLVLVAAWALRLSIYITVRNWGHGEDRRYQAIRLRNEPGFTFKSLYLVFGLQVVLAWVISLPLLGAMLGITSLGWLDLLGVVIWVVGFVFEVGGDWQLARFKADTQNAGKVMDRGLWGLTRHPNYFGEFAMWWGFFAIAASAGAFWSVPGPILISLLLLKVSGVTLLEKDIGERRPQYAEYIKRTNAFFPGLPRRGT